MNSADLDALAALVARAEAVRGTTLQDKRELYEAEIALMDAFLDLLRLARKGLEPPPAGGERTCERCQHRYEQPDLPDAYCARTIFRISRPEDLSKAEWLLCATCDDLGNFCGAFAPRTEGA